MSFGRAGFGPGEIDRSAQQAQRRQSRPDVSASTIKDKTQGAKARLIQDRGFNDASTLTELAAPLQRELKPVFDAAAGLPRVSDSMIDQTDQSVANGLQELLQQQCPAKCERSTFDDLKSFVAELMTADTSEDQAAIPKKYKLMLAIQVADKHLSNPDTGANPSEVREFVESLLREAETEFPKDSGTLKLMTKQMKRKFEAYKAQMGPASSVESQTLSTAMMGQLEVVVVDGAGEPVAEVAPKVKKKVRQRRRRKKTDFLNKKQDHASVEGHNTGSSDDVRAASADAGPVKSDKERAVEKKVRRRRKKGGRVAFEGAAPKPGVVQQAEPKVLRESPEPEKDMAVIKQRNEEEAKQLLEAADLLGEAKAVDTERLAQLDQKAGVVPEAEAAPKPKAAAAVVAEVNAGDDIADNAMRLEVSRGDSIMRPSTAGRAQEVLEEIDLRTSRITGIDYEAIELLKLGIEQNGKLTKEQAERLEYLHSRSEKESVELKKYLDENSECLTDDMLEQIKVMQKRAEAAKKERDELLSRLFKMEGFKESMHHFSANFLDSVVGMYIDVRNENQFTNFARKLHNDELELQRAEDKSYATKQYEKQMHRLNAEGKKVFNEALEEIRHRAAEQSG